MKNKEQYIRLKNIILYILNSFTNGTDYIKLYKILYFANKEQLAEVGIPMVYDNFKAWDLGPVPSFTGSVVKRLETKKEMTGVMKCFDGSLRVTSNKKVSALVNPDVEEIPEFTRNLIDKIVRKYKNCSSKQMSKESHDDAWLEAYEAKGGKNNGKVIINPVSIAKAGGADENILHLVDHIYSNDETYLSTDDIVGAKKNIEDTAFEIYNLMKMTEGWDGDDAEASIDGTEQYSRDVYEEYVERRKCLIDGVNRIPGCYTPIPMGAFYTLASLPVDDTEKFCAWCLEDFVWKDEDTPDGYSGETIMMAPASGFYSNPELGRNQVRLAYVLEKKKIRRALFILEKALERYNNSIT